MDSSEGGGDGGGGEEREADPSSQGLSVPLRSRAAIPEQGSPTHTSAMAPAKEPLTLPRQGAEGVRGDGQTEAGCPSTQQQQQSEVKENQGEGYTSGQRREDGEVHLGVEEASLTGSGGQEEEEAISNQSQNKSKCSLLPQQSQHCSSSSTAQASGTLHSKTVPTPSSSPKPAPSPCASPKHLTCPSSPSAPHPDTEVKDIEGDQGWISGFPQSFNSQQSSAASPELAGTGPASSPTAEDEGPAGVLHSSVTNGNGAKAPEPNDSVPETEVDDEREKDELKEAVSKNLNQDLSPNSLTSHMTIMHSRNSCKTLKCPKCNWHYKSQHTLQVHMKEKHPETGGQCVCGASGGKCICGGAVRGVCTYCTSGKPHPRLARGETYACGYKPYRCEVCDYATSSKGNLSIHMQSDKHLNNVQSGGHSNGHLQVNNSSTSGGLTVDEQAYKLPLAIHTPATQPAKITSAVHSHSHGKRWRCDVCDYETSIARNLRIHTTSEKHTHNMLRLQRGYYLSQCRGMATPLKHLQSTGAELSLTMRLSSQQVSEQPMTLGSTLTPSPSPSPSPPPAPSLSPSGALSLCVFQCLICSSFSSDSLECVEQHLNTPRSLPQSEWCSLVAGGCHCRLCGYTTPLRANFSLHCQTDRHRTRYQLAAHIQEGGDRGQEGAALIAKGNPVQLRCNLCDCVSSSVEKLRGHSLSAQHEAGIRVYRFLQQYDGEVDGGSWLFHCLLCNHSCSSKFQVLKHSQTPTHQQREGLIQLQPMGGEELAAIFTIRKNTEAVTAELSDDMETSGELQVGLQDQTKDSSNMGSKQFSPEMENGRKEREKGELKRSHSECTETDDTISSKRPKIHQQNENQQTVQCPLCQLKVPYTNLRQHLTHVHSVAQDCVDKLISTVSPPLEQPQLHSKVEASTTEEQKMTNGKMSNAKTMDAVSAADAQKNGISTETPESEVAAPKDVTALLTPPLEDNTAHPSNGKVAPQSPTQIPPSSPPTSPSSEPPPLTDRHGYRFRCSRCSLAFPTQEKLQLHWQYHAMRAATECPLCSRQCRSQEALQRHMQNTHSGQQLDSSQGQSTHLLPHTAHYMEQNKSAVQQDFSLSPQIGQEAGEGEEEEMEEEDALDMEKKEQLKDIGSEVDEEGLADTEKHEEQIAEPTLTETSTNSLIRKCSNPPLDRYLDPSRPYKCTICSESFTQKTILLVHFNSVSHLHRARRALQESGAGTTTTEAPRGPDPRPYRCKLCGVGYSQSSTLDIHLRSVLHQTRARAAQNTSASAPTSTTVAQAREEPSKSSALTKRQDAAGSSTSSLQGNGLATEVQSTLVHSDRQHAKKRVAELLASRNQLMLLQQQQIAQAQAHAHLQQQTALLQSQVMHHLPMGADNLFKHHFPVAADNLLSLQQQLLLPFYLAGDMKLNPELAGKIPDLNQFDFLSHAMKESYKTENESFLQTTEKQTPKENSDATVSQQSAKCEANIEESCGEPTFDKTKKESTLSEVDKGEGPISTVKNENQKQEVNVSPINLVGQQCPPPRVPYAAVNGEPVKALLQSYGYELALQYIQSRHRHQQQKQFIQDKQMCSEQLEMCIKEEHFNVSDEQNGQIEASSNDDFGKVESESIPLEMNRNKSEDKKEEKTCCGNGKKCKDCGKFFSDALVLKSHQEYIHRMLFPSSALEKFSKEYRLQYDQMYPITHPKSAEIPTATTPSTAQSTNEESETITDGAQTIPCTQTQSPTMSEPTNQTNTSPSDAKPTATASPPLSPKEPALSQKEEAPSSSTSVTSQSSTQATTLPLSLPNIPMLSLPQIPMPPLPLSKLPMPPIPFPMELPLLSPIVMQSVALQSQPWLDTNVNPDLAKVYQSQLNPALLGQQPSPALLAQQSPLSPALLAQPPQLNPSLIGQPSQPSPVPAAQQPQMSPSILEQQGKRTRTRISEEQLIILRKHFDINSLPSDEEINKMSATSGLPHKVIKHWFRNTLFKERQRDKDSPYNFNNPPTIALEESREEDTQSQSLTISPLSMSPALTSASSQPQPVELQRELHRGRRSSRTRFTEKQLETLQGVFEATPYPREEEYERLSALLSLPNRVIVVWFQNARQRARKSQDRGNEDALGGESKSPFDSIHSQSNSFNMNNDEEENRCVEGQGDGQNENSMDLTYEYYTNPDSPAPESSPNAMETTKGEPVKKMQEDNGNFPHDIKTTKNVNEAVKNIDGTHTEKNEGTQDKLQPSPQKQASVPDTNKESTNPPDVERSAVSKASEEARDTGNLEATSSLSAETKQSNSSQSLPQAQFQCTFCPVSLPSFQLWQEHQTRHLLAAQSQVQLLHSGFTDRTMPYMMLHPNHTLMANQMLTGAMSQLHPNATHPMISHLNNLQMKNTMSDHSGNSLTNLSQNTLASMKQNSTFMAETNFESQRGGKEVEEEHRRDKRQRTTITPEQLEVLYQRYSMDSNPTRGVLESIARDVGLTRRVVQVWFQNTRARERKGQFRSMGPGSTFSLGLNHLRCPFCRALFKVKSALDAHMRSRHWAEAERAGFNLSISNGSTGQIATSSVMERPGPSISCPLTSPAYPVKELIARPPVSSLSITTDLNNPDEDDDYEEEEDEFPGEESSTMADLASSSPEGSGAPSSDWGETPNLQQNYQHPQQQQRQRTQMSHFQILQLRNVYRTHRTPSRQECEALGQELGLPHRVVQVWFQNARAKDKRARSMSSDSVEREAELSAGAGERDRA